MREKLREICTAWNTELHEQVPLSEHTTFRIGGSASDSISTRLVSRPTVVPDNVGAWAVMKVLTGTT